MSNPHFFPSDFLQRAEKLFSAEQATQVLGNLCAAEAKRCFRINTLKISVKDLMQSLQENHIDYTSFSWNEHVFMVGDHDSQVIRRLTDEGSLYQQNPSSFLVSMVLNPKPDEYVLDLCAAPGSKASHMAALMQNEGGLVCVEAVRKRFYKLRSVLDLLGVNNARCRLTDGRFFRAEGELFDKVLVDAPCSSEGRFRAGAPETYRYWSIRKVREMQHKQKGLLRNAGRLVRPGGTLVYATCTFAPEENEAVIDWFLRKSEDPFELKSVVVPETIQTMPAVLQWQKYLYAEEMKECVRILPDGLMEGFFIAKLEKKKL